MTALILSSDRAFIPQFFYTKQERSSIRIKIRGRDDSVEGTLKDQETQSLQAIKLKKGRQILRLEIPDNVENEKAEGLERLFQLILLPVAV